jgi:uncharacterized protein
MRRIVIAGGTGFLGVMLAKYFSAKGDRVTIISRKKADNPNLQNIDFAEWDGKNLSNWINHLENSDVLINLTGKNVNCRYSRRNRNEIIESRIRATAILGEALRKVRNPPKVWINASSATIYKASSVEMMTENAGVIGDDFSMNVCKQWEQTFNNYRIPGIRKIVARIGIVLGHGGGALHPLLNLVNAGLGGAQGDGSQYCSWIHAEDFCRAIDFLIANEQCKGVYNVTSPGPIQNKSFMSSLRLACGIPFGLNLPKMLLKIGAIFIGTETELVLKSRKVFPERLLDEGFVFEFNEANEALNNLCRKEATRSLNSILSH